MRWRERALYEIIEVAGCINFEKSRCDGAPRGVGPLTMPSQNTFRVLLEEGFPPFEKMAEIEGRKTWPAKY